MPETPTIDITTVASIDAVLQLDPLLHIAGIIRDKHNDPHAIEAEVKTMLADLAKVEIAFHADVTANLFVTLTDIAKLAGRIEEVLSDGAFADIDVPPGVQQVARRLADAIPSRWLELARILPHRKTSDALSYLISGTDAGKLAAGSEAMASKADEIADAGGDLLSVHLRLISVAIEIDELIVLLDVEPPDFTAIETKLSQVDIDLEVLVGNLTPLLRAAAAKLDAIETTAFTHALSTAFDALAGAFPDSPVRLNELLDPLRDAAGELHDLATDGIDDIADEVIDEVRAALQASGIARAGKTAEEVLDELIARLNDVDLPGVRAAISDALHEADDAIRQFGATAPAALQEKIDELTEAIANIDETQVRPALDAALAAVNDVLAPYRAALEEIRDAALNAPADIAAQVQVLAGKLGEIETLLQQTADEIEAIDFDAAADESRRIIDEIRSNIEEAVGSAELTPAARLAISFAAQALKEIDLQEEVARPIHAELDKADPAPILAPLQEEIARVRALLQSIVPEALFARLDPPFDEAKAAIEKYTPAALKARVQEELAKLDALLEHADPAPLLTQLEAQHQHLVQLAEQHADLGPLFEAAASAYANARAAFAGLQLEQLLVDTAAAVAALQQEIEDDVHQAMLDAANMTTPLAGFHLGDVLRPLADVVDDLRGAVDSLSDAELDALMLAIVAPIAAVQSLDDLRVRFANGPVIDVQAGLRDLTDAANAVDGAVQAQVDLGETTLDIRLGVHIEAIEADASELEAAMQRLLDRLTPPELVASAIRLAEAARAAMPVELLEITADTPPRDALHLILDTIDPTPLADELDDLGVQIDADLHTCAQKIGDGVLRAVHEIFGIADVTAIHDRVEELLAGVDTQLDALDPASLKDDLQLIANDVVDALRALSPAEMEKPIDDAVKAARLEVTQIGQDILGVFDKPPAVDFPDLETYRPSKVLAVLAQSTTDLKDQLDKILAFDFGAPLVRTLDKARPAVGDVLDEVFDQLDSLLVFLEQQKVA